MQNGPAALAMRAASAATAAARSCADAACSCAASAWASPSGAVRSASRSAAARSAAAQHAASESLEQAGLWGAKSLDRARHPPACPVSSCRAAGRTAQPPLLGRQRRNAALYAHAASGARDPPHQRSRVRRNSSSSRSIRANAASLSSASAESRSRKARATPAAAGPAMPSTGVRRRCHPPPSCGVRGVARRPSPAPPLPGPELGTRAGAECPSEKGHSFLMEPPNFLLPKSLPLLVPAAAATPPIADREAQRCMCSTEPHSTMARWMGRAHRSYFYPFFLLVSVGTVGEEEKPSKNQTTVAEVNGDRVAGHELPATPQAAGARCARPPCAGSSSDSPDNH